MKNSASQAQSPDFPWSGSNRALNETYQFILASGSPRRRELLAVLGLSFTVIQPESGSGVDETPLPGESPPELVKRLSRAKARAVATHLQEVNPTSKNVPPRRPVIIAADTVVVLEDKILGKPATGAEAAQMLKLLRDHRYHYVYSGVTVAVWDRFPPATEITGNNPPAKADLKLRTRLHCSQVWMRAQAELEAYVASGDPLDKAGAYAIQNKAFAPVEHLDGCFASVMGLPLGELAAALAEVGIPLVDIGPRCTQYSGFPCCQQPSPD